MDKSEHVEKLNNLLNKIDFPDIKARELEDFVYAMNERNCWNDDMQLDSQAVITAWKMVQYLINNTFPDSLKM